MALMSAVEYPNVAILGCGKLGQALLVGLLRSASGHPGRVKIRELKVTVRSARTAQLVRERISPLLRDRAVPPVWILQQDQNCNVAEQADIVLLGCKHSSLGELVHDLQGMRHDHRRILISLMGGVSPGLIVEALHFWTGPVVRAVCSVAVAVGESITLLSTSDDHTNDAESRRAVTELFASVGVVQWLPECQMHVASAVGASSLAFFAQMIEGLAQGVAEQHSNGANNAQQLPLETALAITAQAARGTAALLQQSTSPADLVAQVATKGGATAAGLRVLEKEKLVQTLRTCAAITAEATAALSQSAGSHGEDNTTDSKTSRA
uniref:Pyrroline-5-carboxylate reductase n=1 Tax=Penicillium fellutanum TaxID=70095 RepID=PHQD_PENFE|nr:RecName: Full=Pyrroline-5-carboxylate reductase; Short=P5C reductase; Short=P5CR; AltName: Full=Paraherquamide biosynthesis cluster protein D [Penicillium fellutanum]AGA37271.1 pyrroline-5-carboxylate reductase [Penicillium fellutanum]